LPDGRWIGLTPLVGGEVRQCVGLDRHGWSEAWDYRGIAGALLEAMAASSYQ